MGGLRHMLAHLLKALLFSEWCMPAASTGVYTSSGNISAGGGDYYCIVSDHIDQWRIALIGQLENQVRYPFKVRAQNPDCKVTMAMHLAVDRLSKSINSANISMGISSTSSLIDVLAG